MTNRIMTVFGGKGGVGKTTCSAAIALQFASLGQKSIIISSDMAPSLSDIFEKKIGDQIKTIDKNLDAIEICQDTIVNRWKKRFGKDFYDILSHLIDVDGLDSESRHQLLDYIGSAPSLREETMLDLIVDMAEGNRYDRIIWDTAPAGETLNLINMPQYIRKHLRAGAKVFEGLDRISKQIIGKRSIADIMDEWILVSERISRFIHNRSLFIIVANPEALVVNQSRRIIETIEDYQVNIHGMVINRVIENTDSESLLAVKRVQEKYISELTYIAKGLPVVILPLSLTEIKGKEILKKIGKELLNKLNL